MTATPRRRALVTGATGFIGGYLVKSLRADGWDVHAVTRPASAGDRVARLRSAACTLHLFDGTPGSLRACVRDATPDCVWHLATRFVAEHTADDVTPLVRDNIEFGALLFDALTDLATPRVVTVGSYWQQYGNAPYSPLSLYAATKQAFDDIVQYFVEVRRFSVVSCLMTDTYGPDDPRRKLVWQLVDAAARGVTLPMSGEGHQLIDLLHVDDAVRALRVAGDRVLAAAPGVREQWAVRPGQPISVRELVDRLGRARGTTVPVQWGTRPPRLREVLEPWVAGEVLPGWSPTVALDEGLRML